MSWRSNKRRLTTAMLSVCCLLLQGALVAQEKGHGVEVRQAAATLIESEPARIASTGFVVTNTSKDRGEFVEELELPTGWGSVTPPMTLNLDRNERQVRVVGFLIPAGAPSGLYDVTYSVRSLKDYGIRDAQTVKVRVLPVMKLVLLPEEKPDTVIAGDEYRVKLMMINQGNSPASIQLSAKSTENHRVKLTPASVTLPAGGGESVTVEVATDGGAARRATDVLQIRAISDEISAGLTVTVDIIPSRPAKADPYHRMHAKLEMRLSGGDGRGVIQTQFSGGGTLDELGMRSMDFLARAPNAGSRGYYTERDEYYLNYHSDGMDLRLGDQSWELSRLTEYYRYGRGVGLRLAQSGNLTLGVHRMESRWEYPQESQTGAYLENRINDRLGLRLHLLDKRQSERADRIWSLQTDWKPSITSNARLEYARNNGDTDGEAYGLWLDGVQRGVSYVLGRLHADPDYRGYYNDTDYTDANIAFPVSEKLRVRLSGRRWEENLRKDPETGDAPREDFYQAGLSYTMSPRESLSLDYNLFRGRDMLPTPEYDFRETSLRLGWGRSFGDSHLQAYVNLGEQENRLTGVTDRTSRCSVFYSTRTSARSHLTLQAQFGNEYPQDSRLVGGTNAMGISGYWDIRKGLSVSGGYTLNGFDSRNQRIDRQAYLTAVCELPEGRVVSLRGRHTDRTVGEDNSSFMLSYTIPWDMPVSRRRNVGRITGRLYDDEQGNSGIPRVILTANGMTAVTDKDGGFSFQSLPPGSYSISVEQASIGADRVTKQKLPIILEVKSGETAEVRIPVVRSARINGSIARFAYHSSKPSGSHAEIFLGGAEGAGYISSSEPADLTEVGGIGNLLVELSNGAETLRRITDSKGRFSADGLRPGTWKLKAYENGLPPHHYLDTQEIELELKPADDRDVTLRVMPRLRPVKILGQGVVTCSVSSP